MKQNAPKAGLSPIPILIFKQRENLPIPWVACLVAGTLLCVSLGGGNIGATSFVSEHRGSMTNNDLEPPSNDIGTVSPPSAGITGIRYIRLFPHGFEPKKITSVEGRFLLAVDNRSGFVRGEIAFRLEKVGANRVREVRLPLRKRGWREVVDLSPGTYLLTEVNHPRWTCEITIVSR
jgi:hypothetical protein